MIPEGSVYFQQTRGKRIHRGAAYDTRGVGTIPLDIPGARFYRGAASTAYVPEGFFGDLNNKSEAKELSRGRL